MGKLMDGREKEYNPHREALYSSLDYIFNSDWVRFCNQIRKENIRKNNRWFRLLTAIKGEQFVEDLKKFMKAIGCRYDALHIVRKPKGIAFKDRRWKTIPEIWVEQKSGSVYENTNMEGTVCIQVKENRWLTLTYLIHSKVK